MARLRFLLLSFTLNTGSTDGTVKLSGRSHAWPQGQWEVTRVALRSVGGHTRGVNVSGRSCMAQLLFFVVVVHAVHRQHRWHGQGQWEVTHVASRSVGGHTSGVKVSGRSHAWRQRQWEVT